MAAACLFAACSNLGDDYSAFQGGMILPGAPAATGGVSGGPAAQVTNYLTASVSLPGLPSLAGIAPVPKNVAQNISKSAFPNIADVTDPSYSFSATLAQSGGATYTADGTYDSITGTCSFAFAGAQSASEASYTLTVSLWHTDGTPAVKSLVASGSQDVLVAAGGDSFAASVSLAPNLESGAPNGFLSLPINFSDTSVTSVGVTLIDKDGSDVTLTYLAGATVPLSGGSGTITSAAGGLPAGTYTLFMSFMKGTAMVGSRTESLNIYPTMQTKLWWTKDGIGTAATALSVTQFNQKEFYVRGTGGVFYTTVFPTAAEAEDTNNGSFAFPLKTIQEAVNRIVASGDTTSQFTVYIDGKIEGDPDADYSSNQSSLVCIGASSRKILIKGWTGPDTDIVDVKKSKDSVKPGRAFFISANSSAIVAIKDLGITHGANAGHGGGFYIQSCADMSLENCKISECYAASNYDGGGFYINMSTVVLKKCVVTQSEARSGGGVFIRGNNASNKGCLTIENSEISANTANGGGGVYVGDNSVFNFTGGTISGNTATYSSSVTNSGLGGGVYINSSGKCFISGAAVVGQSLASTSSCATSADGSHSNKATQGGGIYNKGELYLGYTDDSTPAAWTGSVCYNYASSDGGGILSYGSSTLVKMNAGSVAYNLCSDGSGSTGGGGGVAVQNSSAFTMSGGTVSFNQTNNKVGGGIYVDSGATLTLNGTAEVSSNKTSPDGTGSMGGAGLFAYRASITMEGNAVVKDNLCKACGGGVYLFETGSAASYASLAMSGNAKILENTSSDGLGGAVYVTQRCSFSMQGAATIPAGVGGTTGAGKNDVCLDENTSVAVPAAITSTATPVATITPQSYTLDAVVLSGTALSAVECAKFAVTQPVDVDFPWELRYDSATGKGVLKQPHSVIYVASPTATPAGSDTTGNGSKANPYATIQEAAKHFGDKTPPVGGTADEPIFENKIYVLTDMTYGAGLGSDVPCYYEIVGCNGGTLGSNVTFTFDTPGDSGLYVAYGQKIKLTHIDITQSSATANNYAAILVENSSTNGVGELWMEDCSIKNMYAKSCSAIAAQGDVHLKNVEISDNKTVPPTGVTSFGPAINSTTGTVSVLGKVVVQNNTVELDDGAGGYVYKEQNVWIGDNPYPTPAVFHPIAVAGPLADGSKIGVTTYDPSATVFTSGYTSAGNTAAPKTYFTSDAGMAVALTTSAPVGEAVLAVPTDLYVSGSSESPAGSDVTGNGSAAKPYASVAQAIMTLDGYGVATNEYTIHVSGTITENVNVPDGIAAAKITIAGTSAATDILDGVDKSGAVVTIDESAIPVDLKNLTITNGNHGVAMQAAATVNIENCVITGNQGSVSGAGVYMGAGGSLTITDTDITQNIATGSGSGGGIYAPYSSALAKFEMTGGSLSNNSAKNGGGASLACIQAANPLLKNVTISGNTATTNGGGVYVTSGRYLTIEGCDISGNTATSGGGIYNAGGCNIKGSTTISANTATSGGAICAATSVTLGGGVYIPAGTAGANDVYLAAGALINVASELTATPTPVATITPIVYNNLTAVVSLAASSTATLDDSIAKFAVTPNALSSWTIVKDVLGTSGILRATNSASGGISISISEGVAFVVTTPKKSGDAASFVVQDTSGASPVAIAADDPYIAIKQNGATVYSANAQSVGAPFLSPGGYQLYCRATVEGLTYDTTTPFEVGDKYTPLTLEAREAGAVVTFSNKAAGPVYYSVNKGTRQEIASDASEDITLAAVGDMVQFYGDNAAYGRPTSTASDSSNISCSKACYVYGNIMSLIKSSGFESETKLTASNTFKNLFRDNSNIYNKTGQSLLLPATTLAISCYYSMFQGCTSLTNAPELPATTLTNMCYYLMFQGCTSLTSAPALPATTLAPSCYYLMFQGCTSLTSAPALPATTLAVYCYFSMFQGCTSLNSVTCLATDISATNCTTNWLSGVAATGTFTKAPGMTAWTSGASGIPSGWTTQDAP